MESSACDKLVGGTWHATCRWAVLGEGMTATAVCRVWQATAACDAFSIHVAGCLTVGAVAHTRRPSGVDTMHFAYLSRRVGGVPVSSCSS